MPMPKCSYCSSMILFGGVREGELRFCNAECHEGGALIAGMREIPEDTVRQAVWKIHQGPCLLCGGQGPVDVHASHRVWSALVVSSWTSKPQISCRRCGIKAQLGGALFSLGLGWWGLPWGLVMAPVQIVRNLWGIAKGPDPLEPSEELNQIARIQIATGTATDQVP